MANTYKLISSNVLTTTAATVTFSSIPSTYTDLTLICSARSNQASSVVSSFLQMNSITSGYSVIFLRGNGSSASVGSDTSQTKSFIGNTNGSTSTSNTFANFEIYIPNYNSSNLKAFGSDQVQEENITSPVYRGINSCLLSDTAAITSLTLSTTGSFVSGSSFYLYGIKNS
jgi:hypothetical protein